jgi:hypothetical protein
VVIQWRQLSPADRSHIPISQVPLLRGRHLSFSGHRTVLH